MEIDARTLQGKLIVPEEEIPVKVQLQILKELFKEFVAFSGANFEWRSIENEAQKNLLGEDGKLKLPTFSSEISHLTKVTFLQQYSFHQNGLWSGYFRYLLSEFGDLIEVKLQWHSGVKVKEFHFRKVDLDGDEWDIHPPFTIFLTDIRTHLVNLKQISEQRAESLGEFTRTIKEILGRIKKRELK